MNFTNEQKKSIEVRNADILVSAAAGSGKTAVLVERILTLITDSNLDVNIDNLLIVTFTEAAGKEMRHRLEKRLNAILDENPNDLNIRKQLVLLNRAYISTIHSFCKKIISQNFTLLDIDTNFRLADKLERTLIEDEVLDSVLENYYSKENNEIFCHLLEMYSEKIEDKNFRDVIYKIYKNSLNHTQPIEWIKSAVNIHKIENIKGSFIERECVYTIKQNLEKSVACLSKAKSLVENEAELEKVYTFVSAELSLYLDFYAKIDDMSYDEMYEYYNNHKKLARYPSISAKKLDVNIADIASKVKALRDSSKTYFGKIENVLFSDEQTIVSNLNFLAPYIAELTNIVIEFSEEVQREKYDKNVLTFNDLEHLAIKILVDSFENGEPVLSSVAKKYQNMFYEIIIDEYQDTNEVQDLILTSISKYNVNKPNKFMVGDVKQSIYKFRGGDPKLFINKYNSYTYDEDSHYRKIDLSKNFRSSKSVIQLVNFVFLQLMRESVGGINYDEEAKLYLGRESDCGESTEILLCDFEEKNDEVKNDFNSKAEFEFEVIANKIKELINRDDLEFENGKIKYNDIAILLRSRSNIDKLVDTLKIHNIPCISKTIGSFYENYEVQLILDYLLIIDNPLNDLPVLTVLKSPIYNITDDELVEIATCADGVHFIKKVDVTFEQTNNQELLEKLKLFKNDLEHFRKVDKEMSISEFILYLYDYTEILAIVKAFKNGDSMVLNLMYLVEKAVDFEKTSFTSIFNFVKYIEKVKTEESDDNIKIVDNSNAVSIMTIHESKGLEFPIVFVSNLDKQFNFQDAYSNIVTTHDIAFTSKVLDPKTRVRSNTLLRSLMSNTIKNEVIAEELRIFYVALTRAREKLIMTSFVSDLESTKKDWYDRFNSDEQELSTSDVLSCKSYLDFLMKPVFAHNSAYFLHDEDSKIDGLYNYDLPLNIEVIKASNYKKLEVQNRNEVVNESESLDIQIQDETYKYEPFTTMPMFTTISEIKRKFNAVERVDFEITTSNLQELAPQKVLVETVPNFISNEVVSATNKGIVIHKVYEKLDFTKDITLSDVEKCVNDLHLTNQLTDEEVEVIDCDKVHKFFTLDIFKRIKNSKNIYKEQIFTLGIPAEELYPEVSDIENINTNTNIVVKGMIDCFFEEDDCIVLIDFKTDFVTNGNVHELANNYKIQLDLYARALEQSLHKVVKEKYLYFYNINKLILCE